MFKYVLVALVACVVYTNAGVITPLVAAHSVSSQGSIQSHPSPVVHAVPVIKSVPIVHAAPVVPVAHVAPVFPLVKAVHAPIVAVHH